MCQFGKDYAKGVGWQDTITASGALINWNAEPCGDADLKRLHAVLVANDPDSIGHTEAQEQMRLLPVVRMALEHDHRSVKTLEQLSKWRERRVAMDI